MAKKIKSKKPNIKRTATKPKQKDDISWLDEEMPSALNHYHHNDAEIKKTLGIVGNQLGLARLDAIKRFVNGDDDMTHGFWHIVWSIPDNDTKFNRVNYCYDCQKFDMGYEAD